MKSYYNLESSTLSMIKHKMKDPYGRTTPEFIHELRRPINA